MLKAVCQNTLPFHSHRKITARFDGGSLTSDGIVTLSALISIW